MSTQEVRIPEVNNGTRLALARFKVLEKNSMRTFQKVSNASSVLRCLLLGIILAKMSAPLQAEELSAAKVKTSIDLGKRYLAGVQEQDGGWRIGRGRENEVGITSLAVMALINSGDSPREGAVLRGLNYLRDLEYELEVEPHHFTYNASLLLMALCAARDPNDIGRITTLATRLEEAQVKNGNENLPAGGWSYGAGGIFGGDPSNTQYAILGLREAAEYGVPVSRKTWELARDYWVNRQNPDGGWSYGTGASTGSMTVAGIASLSIAQQMLISDDGVSDEGVAPCCRELSDDRSIERAIKWMASHIRVGLNPNDSNWLLYYMYGLERAGRLSGLRFFGDHDWYREGASFLIENQNPNTGFWIGLRGAGDYEQSPVLATSFCLLFLSKGLSPVLINKLKYGPRKPGNPLEIAGDDWNRHPRDIRNLVEHLSGMKGWPVLMTSQELDLPRAATTRNIDAFMQAPVLFITGEDRLTLEPDELKLLKDYVQNGGFIFGVATCRAENFEAGFREFVKEILPNGENELKPLGAEHPVFRSEYNLQGLGIELLGAETGCRTAIIYCAEDLGCYWQYATRHAPPNRNPKLTAKVIRATKIGTNVIAYATGREILNKLEMPQFNVAEAEDSVERGLLQIAQIRHAGAWNSAPRALQNLLTALNQTAGIAVSHQSRDLLLADPQIYNFPLVYMHGRQQFQFNKQERDRLRKYLEQGGVLFADSCCGAKLFDKSFREMLQQVFPEKSLERIPLDHELFSESVGQDVRKLKRRVLTAGQANAAEVKEQEAVLEGIELDGRYAVIYSKYDLSCALERQSTIQCEGYTPDDAAKLAMNIVLYAMVQNFNLPTKEK